MDHPRHNSGYDHLCSHYILYYFFYDNNENICVLPKLSIEKTLFALLVSSMGINSMVFMFCHVFFIFTLKYDLFFVNVTLEILPDVEYFVDFEENAKMMI